MISLVVYSMYTIIWDVAFLRRSIKRHWRLSSNLPEFHIGVKFVYRFITRESCCKRSIMLISLVLIKSLLN